MNTRADVSVIIVNWNTRDILRECLASVFAETRVISCEVIVVDNGSTDRSVEMVRREFPTALLIETGRNLGYAAGCNRGIRASRGEYVLLLNADIIIVAGAIRETLAFAASRPRAGIVTCRVLEAPGRPMGTCFRFQRLSYLAFSVTGLSRLFPKHSVLGQEWMGAWDRTGIREVEAVTGCFMLVRRSAVNEVGPMDEGFFMYAEEADWCLRFRKHGYRNLFFGDREVIHAGGGGQSSRKARTEMHVTQRKSLLRFFTKHRGHGAAFLANLMFGAGDTARLTLLLSSRFAGTVLGLPIQEEDGLAVRYAASLRFHLTGAEP